MGAPNNSLSKLSGLGLQKSESLITIKRTRSLSNLNDKTPNDTKEEIFMKNLKELREYLLSKEEEDNPKTKDTILRIFNNSEEQIREALNTIYLEGDSYQTVFYEYCSEINKLTEEEKTCIQLMLSLGADINKCTTKGYKEKNKVEFKVKPGECIEDSGSANALLWAMTKGNLDLVTFLASQGAEDTKGMTGMMIGHHNESRRKNITDAYIAGIKLRTKGGTRRRRIKKRKTRVYRRIK